MKRSWIIAALSILLTLSVTAAYQGEQEDESEEATVKIGTDLLQIDVVVTDKRGRLIDNLKAEDFELSEDDKPQSIAFFSLVKESAVANGEERGAPPPSSSSPSVTAPDSQVYVLFVDDLHIGVQNINNVRKLLRGFVSGLRPGDRVAVVTPSGALGFLQQLTGERRITASAIERLTAQQRPAVPPGDPTRMSDYQAKAINDGDRAALDLAVSNYVLNTRAQTPRDSLEQIARSTAQQAVRFLAQGTTFTLSALRRTILSLGAIPGRKNLILITDGFLLEEKEVDHNRDIRRVVDAATRAGVVIYSLGSAGLEAFDTIGNTPGGLRVADTTGITFRLESERLTARNFGMTQLAQRTGGVAVVNNNNLHAGLERMAADNRCYYVLAYYPEKERQDGKFHKITIHVKNSDDLIVRTRQGFIAAEAKLSDAGAKPPKEKKEGQKSGDNEALRKVLFSVTDVENIRVKMAAGFLMTGNQASNAIISLAVKLSTIQFEKDEGNYRNTLTSTLVVIAEDGKVVNTFEDAVNLKFKEKEFNSARQSWFVLGKNLTLKPGFYSLRFAVYDPVGKLYGSSSDVMEIPDLSKPQPVLSEIILVGEQPAAQVNSGDNSSGINGSALAIRQFSEKETLGYLAYLYNMSAESADLMQRVEFLRNNKSLFVSKWAKVKAQADSGNRLFFGGRLSLAGLAAGNYQLKIEVKDNKSGKVAAQTQSFVIEN